MRPYGQPARAEGKRRTRSNVRNMRTPRRQNHPEDIGGAASRRGVICVGLGIAAAALFWVVVWLLAQFTEVMTPRRVTALFTAFAAGVALFGIAAGVAMFWPRRRGGRDGNVGEEVERDGRHQDCHGQGADDSDAQ